MQRIFTNGITRKVDILRFDSETNFSEKRHAWVFFLHKPEEGAKESENMNGNWHIDINFVDGVEAVDERTESWLGFFVRIWLIQSYNPE